MCEGAVWRLKALMAAACLSSSARAFLRRAHAFVDCPPACECVCELCATVFAYVHRSCLLCVCGTAAFGWPLLRCVYCVGVVLYDRQPVSAGAKEKREGMREGSAEATESTHGGGVLGVERARAFVASCACVCCVCPRFRMRVCALCHRVP